MMKHARNLIAKMACMMLIWVAALAVAQAQTVVKGHVADAQGEDVIGASVVVKDRPGIGTVTDVDGNFSLAVPDDKVTLVISYVGMASQERKIVKDQPMNVVLKENDAMLDEVVVVGYGQQKKASIVGSITQTKGEVLERAGGVSSVGAALTGNLPGVITYQTSGLPGEEDPEIVIRAQTSWNNSAPLILVDGIEREMSSIDISSVESISVLKDASATAVYGVKGANGVILITTKRGTVGRANVRVRANMTAKLASKLPKKSDSYDALMVMNRAIEHEMGIAPGGWSGYMPMAQVEKYRNPQSDEDWDRYPNVDWERELFKKVAFAYNASVNVSGGSKIARYFVSADYQHEGDLFKEQDNHRGYNSKFDFNRINVRSNLDFTLTPTTEFSANLFGSNGVTRRPNLINGNYAAYWNSAYKTAPDAMRPIYSDGTWGYYAPWEANVPNSVYSIAYGGDVRNTAIKINTDFALKQDLKFLTPGLKFTAKMSYDFRFLEEGRGINDDYNDSQRKWVDPETGEIHLRDVINPGTQLDPTNQVVWTTNSGHVNMSRTYRKLYYSFQLDYSRKFGKHEVGALALFSRDKVTGGSEFSHYREDWVFRLTYNYADRYFFETNGAYNGSEKFGPDHRFDFFPSFSAGWMLSNESWMQSAKSWMDMLKFRASWGRIGDDNVGGRWLYQDQLAYGGKTQMGMTPADTPYTFYKVSRLGNPDLKWETVEKQNYGIDYSFLGGLIAGSVDVFRDHRTDILMDGGQRAVPSYFGVQAPTANMGETKSHGFELELRSNHTFANGIRLWGNFNWTFAKNKIVFRDDPQLYAAYRKQAGYAIGQYRSHIDYGYLNTWDDVYGTTEMQTSDGVRLPGDYGIVDFNADGIIDTDDSVPTGFSGIPQNTYNATIGLEWKGWSCFVQFYGVKNVSRLVTFPTFQNSNHAVFDEGSYWQNDGSGDVPLPRWTAKYGDFSPTSFDGTRYLFDGSYLRLKNAEVAYTFKQGWVKRIGMSSMRIYLNGDNLALWTKMPDDRESNGAFGSSGAYPTVRRFNLGLEINF